VVHTLKNQFLQMAGVDKVSVCRAAPASSNTWNNSIRFDNQTEEVNFRTNMKAADEDYITTFGLELVAGKNISPADTVREFLVNQAFVRKLNFQSPEEIIGKMISANGGRMVAPVVGVVKDFHEFSFHEEIGAVAMMTDKGNYSNYAVKLNLKDASKILASIEKAWIAQHPDQIFEYEFLDEAIAGFYHTEEILFKQIQILSFIAIFIGCLGLYGLVLFMANQKSKEIGIRKVLGGSISHILWIFGKEFALLILIAFFIAAPIGWWAMNQWLQNFKYHIEIGVSTFVLSIATALLIALITVSWQSIKAALMNPVNSLRSE
jgi:ABC-type antimicrobial peptide transport system permease subunit